MPTKAQTKLQQALILLLDEEEFDHLSVSKICQTAGVNRSTFYSYYDNQYDLLEDAYDYLVQLFRIEFKEYQTKVSPEEDRSLVSVKYLKPYLEFVRDHARVYRIYLTHQRDFHHQDRFDQLVANIFRPRYQEHGITDERKIRYMSSFFIAGITQVISGWLRNDCQEEIEFIVDIIQTCIPQSQTDK